MYLFIREKNIYLFEFMRKIEACDESEGIAINKKFQNNIKKLAKKDDIFYDENKIFKEYIPENTEVIKSFPLKNSKIFLGKKREEVKGIFQTNNIYKNGGEIGKSCAFHSIQYFDNSKFKMNPIYIPQFHQMNESFLNLQNDIMDLKQHFYKPFPKKINIIINNYITYDKPINNKKIIFGISTNKTKLKDKYQNSAKSTNNSISNKTESNNEGNNSPINSLKKFEIFKTDNICDKDILNYDKIKKFHKFSKRGRKALKEGKRQHNALDQDNIIRKIQVHFLSFIIYFCNDLIHTVFSGNKDLSFKNIQYELKKTVNHAYIENLKSKTIGDILQLKASPKNKKFNGDINKKTFDYICNNNMLLKKFFEISYLDMFNNYYCQNKREFIVEGYKVILSQRTRLFNDLISKNLSSAEKLKEIAEEYFFNKKKNLSPFFVINKK